MAPAKSPNPGKDSISEEHQQQQPPRTYKINGEAGRRAPKGLNDCLLTALTPTSSASNSNLRNNNDRNPSQLQPAPVNGQASPLNYDIATLHENQRFSYSTTSVLNRPNVQHPPAYQPQQPSDDQANILTFAQLQEILSEPLSTSLAPSYTASAAAQQRTLHSLLPLNLLDLANSLVAPAPAPAVDTNAESFLLQRLQLIKHFLALTAKADTASQPISLSPAASATTRNGVVAENCAQSKNKPLMVHTTQSNTMERDVVVNSTSLEDVVLSEMSDNRAQSIQSLNSVETPTPDTTPSYDELQQRLETSNRNIQNMQEQQQQLLRLQNAAKQHLSDMEQLRQHAGKLSFGADQPSAPKNANGAPEYESIDQVHSDMATLVGRMKNLTAFIHGQNELSNLLGDDGPEMLAEQQALQQKLESLRTQRDEMRHLVDELQDINRTAEESANILRNDNTPIEQLPIRLAAGEAPNGDLPQRSHAERTVPVSYSRTVPIELTNGMVAGADEPPENAATALLIQQKVADIETMRSQLKRLKDMMETVNIIEARTTRDSSEIGLTSPREMRSQSNSTVVSNDRERTPVIPDGAPAENEDNDGFISRKMRMLNEVTSDLRAQAESLQAERDRIKLLKEEIVRRKNQAAAAAQLGEDALKRSSLTPTPTPRSRPRDESPPLESNERDQLKLEYEVKKKEFEQLCQRLQQDENSGTNAAYCNNQSRRDTVSEADDEADGEELNDSDFLTSAAATASGPHKYFPTPQRPTPSAQSLGGAVPSTSSTHRLRSGKDSLDSTLSSTHTATEIGRGATQLNGAPDGASVEAGSMQSGSSQSYSMPPPMPAMGPCSSWPPMPPIPSTWNPPLYYGFGMPAPPPPPLASAPIITAATVLNSGVSLGAQYTPSSLTSLQSGVLPTVSVAATVPNSTLNAPPNSSECIYSSTNAVTIGSASGAPGTTSSTASAAAQLAAEPVLMQQFVQTQQMLINSVCQCNQMLWHQQREIDALNNTIHVLQERLLSLTGGIPPATELSFNCRAESVPPPSLAGALPNNLYTGTSRSQSEQPALFLPNGLPATRSAFTNIHQQQQFQQRQRGAFTTVPGGYNYSSETQQQQNATSSNTSIYATLNNAVPPPPPTQAATTAPLYNNEAPQSPLTGTGPGPIFMNHHNNAIHQNNANLRTQNHHANNLQQPHSNINGGAGNTLNNQVPPGNRANNYWDNFRSYSRQNLLSTNSNKSNEEQQNQNQQQQQQLQQYHDQQQQRQQRLHEPHTHYQQRLPPPQQQQQQQHRQTAPLTATNLEQLQQQHQQQQQQQPALPQRQQLYRPAAIANSTNNCNNLNYDRNAFGGTSKYIRALQRSRINQYQQQQQQQQNIANNIPLRSGNNLYQPTRTFLGNLNWPENAADADGDADADADADVDSPYDSSYNIVDSDLAAIYAPGGNLRNMNLNFGNSPHYQRNKLLAKPTCRATTAAAAASVHNQNRLQQQSHFRNLDVDFESDGGQQRPPHQHLRNMSYTPAQQQQRFVDLLPATPQNHLRNRERADLLLRTVTAAADEDDVYGYGGATLSDSATLTTGISTAVGSFVLNDNANNNNEDEDDDGDQDDDDTTSEEIKRNLLVNALKNDKFTTKFYESIKEDVFRRLESMLLEKESVSNCQSGQQPYNDVSLSLASGSSSGGGRGGGGCGDDSGNSRDPMRKLYLNASMGNQQQRPPQGHVSTAQPMQQLKLDLDEPMVEQAPNPAVASIEREAEAEEGEEAEELKNAETESNNADNERNFDSAHVSAENEKPEDENETENDRYNNVAIAANVAEAEDARLDHRNWRKDAQSKCMANGRNPPAVGKKRKNQQRCENIGDDDGARSLQLQNSLTQAHSFDSSNVTTTQATCSAHSDLINFIIMRIKTQTHSNTLVNDGLLVEIAKLTASAAQNSAASGSLVTASPHISPKKIYAKMKKHTMPRQRDEFLIWYRKYLETLFPPIEQQPQQNGEHIQQQAIIVPAKHQNENATSPNSINTNQIQRVTNTNAAANAANNDVNDEDLAEADQNSINTSSGSASNQLLHAVAVNAAQQCNGHKELGHDAAAMSAAAEEIDCENNENPDEESASGATAALTGTRASLPKEPIVDGATVPESIVQQPSQQQCDPNADTNIAEHSSCA